MKITPNNQWTYSCDSDFWYQDFYPSKQEAIEAGLEEYPSGCYVGFCYNLDFTYDDMDFSEYVIEHLTKCLEEEVDEYAPIWAERVSWDDEQLLGDSLAKCILKWLEDCQLQPSQYIVNDIEWVEGECENGCC